MKNDTPTQLIAASFPDQTGAEMTLNTLKQAQKESLIHIQNAAVLHKDIDGKLHIKETSDLGEGKGAVLGGVFGAAIGLLAGPALIVPAAVGALLGGLVAHLVDTGFPDDRLRSLGESLPPGSSAIIAVVEHRWATEVQQTLETYAGQVLLEELNADVATQLEQDHKLAYNALATQEGFASGRMIGEPDSVQSSALIVGQDEATGGQFVATENGFAVTTISADQAGAAENRPSDEQQDVPAVDEA